MKKRFWSLILALALAFSLTIPAGATFVEAPMVGPEVVSEKEMLINDDEFLADAMITKTDLGNDVYQIELRSKEAPCIEGESGDVTSTTAVIVAFSEEDLVEIEKKLEEAITRGASNSTWSNDWQGMGNTMYLETVINYSYKTVSGETYYRMNMVTTKVQVRNGTTYSNRYVKFASTMADQNVPMVTKTIPSVAAATYAVTAPSGWDYVRATGLRYGVFFYCTATNSSGDSAELCLYHDLFRDLV